jgi:competence protein ComEA
MLRKLFAALVGVMLSLNLAFAATDANTASKDELDKVKGIGPAIAQKIVDERQKNGPFKSLDDLAQRVKGVGDTSVKKMAAEGLTVGGGSAGATTAGAPAKADMKAEKKAKKADAAKTDTTTAAAPLAPAADKASDAKAAKKSKAEKKAGKAAAKADAAASAASAPEKKSKKAKKDPASAPKA